MKITSYVVAVGPLVDPVPGHGAADAEEVPEVAKEATVEGVVLPVAPAPQVGDARAGHELPGGGVGGSQVEVAAQQNQHHHAEHPCHGHAPQQHTVSPQPRTPPHLGPAQP